MIQQMREAKEKVLVAKNNWEVHIGVFVGSPRNITKLQEAQDLMSAIQRQYPQLPIETFVVPIPQDDISADMMRRALMENIKHVFDTAFPEQEDLN